YQGDHLKKSLLHTALLGAVFVLICDIIGRVIIYPYEIPISLTVGVIGSAIFIYLLVRRRKYGVEEKDAHPGCYRCNPSCFICCIRFKWKHRLHFTEKNN